MLERGAVKAILAMLLLLGCAGPSSQQADAGSGDDGKADGNQTGVGAVVTLVGNGGKCLDATGGSSDDGTRLQLWDCNGTAAQRWTFEPDGSLVGIGGKCLDAQGGRSADSTPIQLWDCNGRAGQHWKHRPDLSIVGIGGKCLDGTGGSSDDGTPIQLWDCNRTSAQAWTVMPTRWPNALGAANSSPWLVAHHAELTEIHPRVLVLDFDNTKTITQARARVDELIAAFKEGSRYHGYSDATAKPFLSYELVKLVDLTDPTPPPGYPFKNSSRMPRKPSGGEYILDIRKLFDQTFVQDYGFPDPDDPARDLTMCELFRRGNIHELWVITEQNDPDATIAPEGKEQKQKYDANGQPIAGAFDACAGNGCFMAEDIPNCGVTVKFLSLLLSRGNGCQVHSQGHSIEGNFARGGTLPFVSDMFQHFANLDLDTRLGLPFHSWYDCASTDPSNVCMSYPTVDSVAWRIGTHSGTIPVYDQGCGNVHFPPNARVQYDYGDSARVSSTCQSFGLHDGPNGTDAESIVTPADWGIYESLSPDCGGAWNVYWRQNVPGLDNAATSAQGYPLGNWWTYLFY
jgi:hypothetical protein